MKKFFAILSITIILVGISVFEEIFANNFISNLSKKAEQTSVAISINKENINNEMVNNAYKNLKNYWNKSKKILCYFTNYEKIKTIDESVIKIATAIEYNEISLAIENIAIIKEYERIFNNIVGFNINNLL